MYDLQLLDSVEVVQGRHEGVVTPLRLLTALALGLVGQHCVALVQQEAHPGGNVAPLHTHHQGAAQNTSLNPAHCSTQYFYFEMVLKQLSYLFKATLTHKNVYGI